MAVTRRRWANQRRYVVVKRAGKLTERDAPPTEQRRESQQTENAPTATKHSTAAAATDRQERRE